MQISHNHTHVTSPLSLPLSFHPGPLDHHRALGRAPRVRRQLLTSYLTHDSVCMSVLPAPLVSLSFPHYVHESLTVSPHQKVISPSLRLFPTKHSVWPSGSALWSWCWYAPSGSRNLSLRGSLRVMAASKTSLGMKRENAKDFFKA